MSQNWKFLFTSANLEKNVKLCKPQPLQELENSRNFYSKFERIDIFNIFMENSETNDKRLYTFLNFFKEKIIIITFLLFD